MPKLNPNKINIIAGLGNPDPKHENTYHNVGKAFVDHMAGETKGHVGQWKKYKDLFEYIKIFDSDRVLIKSTTYMNRSGRAVKQSLENFGNEPTNLMVAHDDADIDLGKYKISFSRGSAGHKGVQSVMDYLGTHDFWRLRIGIRPERETRQSGKFVLTKISKRNMDNLQNTFTEIEDRLISGN